MQGGESVRTKDRKKKEQEIARLHEKTFRAWANSQLRRRNVKIETSLAESFHDGLTLIALLEVLSGEKCQSKYHKEPEKEIQKLENITIAIEFLKKFIPNVNVGSKDIVDGNLKVILGLVWRLILNFQVEVDDGENTDNLSAAQRSKQAKLKLLKWCQDTTAGHKHVDIQNFESSWYDGMAFCALVHAMDPSIIDYDSLSPDNAKENLALAFDLAEKHFGIPTLLDPEDIIQEDPLSRPDEQCFMTYISAFPVAMLQHQGKRKADQDKEILEREQLAREQAEAARKAAEAERLAREKAEEELRRREAENEAKRKAEEEERLRREREAAEKAEADARAEALRRAKEEEERRLIADRDEMRRRAEEEAREKAFEEDRKRLEEENRKLREALLAARGKLIGRLNVQLIQARGLKQKADAYCTLFLERQKEKTRTVKNTKEPKWNAEFEFYVSEKDASLDLTVFHRVWLFSDDFLGHVSIPVSELRDGEETSEWYSLKSRKKKDQGPRGEVKLKLLYRLEN